MTPPGRALALPLLVLALAAPALAGCLGVPGGPTPTADGPVALHAFGPYESPSGSTFVAATVRDVTGDGVVEIFLAQEDGHVTALDVTEANASRRALWDREMPGFVEDMVLVGGARGPALAVVTSGFRISTPGLSTGRLTLLEAATGREIASQAFEDHEPLAVRAADLDGDGAEDLVLMGWDLRPPSALGPEAGPYPPAEVLVVDGAFDDGGLVDRLLRPVLGDDAIRWRTRLEGEPRVLAVGPGPLVLAGTSAGLTSLGPDGERSTALDEGPVTAIAVPAEGDGASGTGLLAAVGHAQGVSLLAADGATRWRHDLNATVRDLAIADLGHGPEVLVLWHADDPDDGAARSGLASLSTSADGPRRIHVALDGTDPPKGLLVGPVAAPDRPGVVVAGPHPDMEGQSRVVLVDADGTVAAAAATKDVHPVERLVLADVLSTGGLEVLVAGGSGHLSVFGAVPAEAVPA